MADIQANDLVNGFTAIPWGAVGYYAAIAVVALALYLGHCSVRAIVGEYAKDWWFGRFKKRHIRLAEENAQLKARVAALEADLEAHRAASRNNTSSKRVAKQDRLAA